MIWLTWRQQRLEAAMTALALALTAALLVPLGLHIASVYDSSGVAACVSHGSQGAGCGSAIDSFQHRFEHAGAVIPWLNLLPGLFGILFVAPLVLELEHGTFRLAWTQSVTRRRWLATKLTTIAVCALVATFALSALMTWWRGPLDQLQGRMAPNVFDFEGVVPYAYVLFAVALAVALGVFTRRTIVATLGALLGYFVLRISIQTWIRQRYLAPLHRVWRPDQRGPANLSQAWSLQSGPSDRFGHAVNPNPIFRACSHGTRNAIDAACVQAHGLFSSAVYQPAGRFWLFQGIESAIFAGLALVLLAAAVWWLRNRVA